MRTEVTADNTSIRVSWQWSRQGVLMCADLVRVHYQPEGGSLMMYTVNNTTATSATLPNLPGKKKSRLIPAGASGGNVQGSTVCLCCQCDTEYTIWFVARGGQSNVFPEWFFYLQGVLNIPYIHLCMLYSLSQCLL